MEILSLTVGPIDENCYLVHLPSSHRLYVIDPGADAPRIVAAARRFTEVASVRILLTHAHVDHISAAGEVARELKIDKAMLDPADLPLYRSPVNAIPPILPPARGLPETTDFVTEGEFEVLRVPGHTPGGCAFLFKGGESKVLYSGDTLFAGSIGRTDLPGGDYETLIDSIRSELAGLPRETRVFPGHGGSTSIGEELDCNPYLRGITKGW